MDLKLSQRKHAKLVALVKELGIALEILGRDHPLVRVIADQLRPPAEGMAGYDPDPAGIWSHGGLTEDFWVRNGQRVGASARQVRYAASRVAGGNRAASARFAGYSKYAKQVAQTVERSPKVVELRARAAREIAARTLERRQAAYRGTW
jgi:hypothetical protein